MIICSIILPYSQTFHDAFLLKDITHICNPSAWYLLPTLPKTVVLAIAR